MKASLIEKIRCPARDCDSRGLVLAATGTAVVEYISGAVEEVKEGTIVCPRCGRVYPITEYVPSFEQLFPDELREEASYWDRWYGFMWDRGDRGFFDLRAPRAQLINEGIEVADPSTSHGRDLAGTHSILADDPLIRDAEVVLDIGCGTGWSSLYLARRGHQVVGFDPSAGNMRLAKRYAIEQGVYVEYVGAAVGYLSFEPGWFDAVFGLHSMHHVPRLKEEMRVIRGWLRDGGVIAVDEHIGNNQVLAAVARKMHEWAQAEVYPRVRTLDAAALEGLPRAGHSRLEDAGSQEVIEALLENFEVESCKVRNVALDQFTFIYYLSTGYDEESYHYSSQVLARIYSLFADAFPEEVEYITLVGRKVEEWAARRPDELVQRAVEMGRTPGNAGASVALLSAEVRNLSHAVEQRDKYISDLLAEIGDMRNVIDQKNQAMAKLEEWAHGMQARLRARDVVLRVVNSSTLGKLARSVNRRRGSSE